MLIDEGRTKRLTKSFLIQELSRDHDFVAKLKKEELVTLFFNKIEGNDLIQLKIIKNHPAIFALHPNTLEYLLGISKTERSRWTKESKLQVVYYETFRKWGQDLEYPMYNYYEAIQIRNQGLVEKWRNEHKKRITKIRKVSAKTAVRTRKQNQSLIKSFYENEWKAMLKQWYKDDPIVGASLQLAFWTMWVNRYAKEMQIKEINAIKKAVDYREKKELFYHLKGEAIKELIKSPLCKIQFYRPEDPDKISNLAYCPHHYECWVEERKFDYISKWDFFWMNEKDIKKCPSCSFNVQKDYYSLFFLSISFDDIKFSFHVPYQIGTDIFPNPKQLENVIHEEQEGFFRFGRGLFDSEKIIFNEKNILKYFQESLEKYQYIQAQLTPLS